MLKKDKFLDVKLLTSSKEFINVIYAGMHQCYYEKPVHESKWLEIDRDKLEDYIIKNLLKGGRGHFSPLEHATLALNLCYIPHSVIQQLRTHRIGIGFSVQSFRYTSKSITNIDLFEPDSNGLEKAIYFRPIGKYLDRDGNVYEYTHDWRLQDISDVKRILLRYKEDLSKGKSPEHARGKLPFDYRQHAVVSFNLRSLFHVLDLRTKKDAQLEIIQLSDLMFNKSKSLAPKLFEWYKDNRYGKARLSP